VRFGREGGTDGGHLVLNPLEAVEDDGPVASLDVVEERREQGDWNRGPAAHVLPS
jgi:hypothetical protein